MAREQLDRLEKAIAEKLIPAVTGQTAMPTEMRDLLALPALFGGLGIAGPNAVRESQYEKSIVTTKPFVKMFLEQQGDARMRQEEMEKIKGKFKREKNQELKQKAERERVVSALPANQSNLATVAQENALVMR